MKKFFRILVGILIVLFGFGTAFYSVGQFKYLDNVFPWGISLMFVGIGIVILGALVIFTRVSIRQVLEDIF